MTSLPSDSNFDAESYYDETRPGAGLLFQERVSTFTKKQASRIFHGLYQTLRRAEKARDQATLAWTNLKIAMMLRGQRQHAAAVQVLSRVLSIFESSGDEFGLGVAYDELSCVNRELSRNALSLQYSDRAVKIFQRLGRSVELGWTYDNIAITYFNMSRQKESLAYARKARAIFEQHKMKSCLAWNACSLGNLHFEMGQYGPAEIYYTEALNTFTALDIKQGQAWSRLWLGMLNRARSEFDKAIPYMERAQAEFKSLHLDDRAGWCLLNIAAIKWVQGKADQALQLNKKALRYFQPLHNYDGLAWGTFQMAQIFRDQGLLLKSWEWVRRSLELYDHIANQKGTGWAQNELGRVYDAMKDTVHARECFLKADSIAEQLDSLPLKVEVNKNLANHYMDQGCFNQALGHLSKSRSICDDLKANELQASVLIAAARYALIVDDRNELTSCLQQADMLIKKSGLLQLMPGWALCQAEAHVLDSKYDQAKSVLQAAQATCQALKMKTVGADIAFGLLQLQYRGKLASANKALRPIQNGIRTMGLRKMKAKVLALLAIRAQEVTGSLDLDLCRQSLEVLDKADLVLLRWQFLELFATECRTRGDDAQALIYENDQKAIEILPGRDAALFHRRRDYFAALPISIIS